MHKIEQEPLLSCYSDQVLLGVNIKSAIGAPEAPASANSAQLVLSKPLRRTGTVPDTKVALQAAARLCLWLTCQSHANENELTQYFANRGRNKGSVKKQRSSQ